jgi:putative hemolysin
MILLLTAVVAVACGPTQTPAPAASQAALPNPASEFCETSGGSLEIRTAADGSQTGVCVFADGSECEEWVYFRGECGPGGAPGAQAAPAIETVSALPLTVLTLKNSMYHSPDWGDFQLVEGVFLRPPQAPGESAEIYKTEFREPGVFGDLDADGVEDAIVFLSTQNGGTGHFVELAVVLNRDGRAENVSTVSLGDRVGIEAARIEAGVIILDMRVHGPNDPMCCASQLETWRFKLEGEALVRQP